MAVLLRKRDADTYGNNIVGTDDYTNKNWSTGRKGENFASVKRQ